MSGLEKYRLADPPRQLTWKQRVIERALTEVPIEEVLNDLFEIYVPRDAKSWKVRCPLAYEHEDGGLDKQFRVYSDNNRAYCFAMHGSFDSLSLWTMHNPAKNRVSAAEALLAAYGKSVSSKTYQERMAAVEAEVETLDADVVVQAFKVFLSGHPKYEDHQYGQDVLHAVNSFLESVRAVCQDARTTEEIETWYQTEKAKVKALLDSL